MISGGPDLLSAPEQIAHPRAGSDPSVQSAKTAQIVYLGEPDRHFWLLWSVARVMGVNLGETVTRGRLTQGACRSLINRCRQCPQVPRCENWLGDNRQDGTSAPDGCPIAADLDRLRR